MKQQASKPSGVMILDSETRGIHVLMVAFSAPEHKPLYYRKNNIDLQNK